VTLVLWHTVEFRMPAAEDIQPVVVRIRAVVRTMPVQLLVDTVQLVVDIAMVAGNIVELQLVSDLDQERMPHQRDQTLILETGRNRMKVDFHHIALCFSCLS